jgi:hypothetical protein
MTGPFGPKWANLFLHIYFFFFFLFILLHNCEVTHKNNYVIVTKLFFTCQNKTYMLSPRSFKSFWNIFAILYHLYEFLRYFQKYFQVDLCVPPIILEKIHKSHIENSMFHSIPCFRDWWEIQYELWETFKLLSWKYNIINTIISKLRQKILQISITTCF